MSNEELYTEVDDGKQDACLPLFRPEVIAAQGSQMAGGIRLAQPASAWLVSGVTLIIIGSLISFVLFGSVVKKAHIAGITVPTAGSLSIIAPNSGVLAHNFVVEGQRVGVEQPLFELSTARQSANGEISELILQQLSVRKQSIDSERRLRKSQYNDKKRDINERLLNLDAEKTQFEQELSLSESRLNLAQKSLRNFEALEKSGFVSAAQMQQKQEDLIDITTRVSGLSRSKLQLEARRLSLLFEINTLNNGLEADLAQLERAEASINQEVVENQSRKTSLIVAPQVGVLTSLTYHAGQAVNAGQVLATLIPALSGHGSQADNLEVHLYAPSRAMGFVAVGQSVLIRYQAYPYQKFGLQEGIIIDVGRTPFSPNELPANLASTILSNVQQSTANFNGNEGLYRVRVSPNRQTIFAYGKEQALKPGMTLEADIMQDRRKIWEWIMEPLLAVSHR